MSLPATPLSPSNQNFPLQTSPPPTRQVLQDVASKLGTVEAIHSVVPNWAPLEAQEASVSVPTIAAMPDDGAQAPAPYDLANEADDENAYRNIATLKLPFNTEDPKYWFKNFERKLKTFGVKSQGAKKDALHGQLPLAVENEVKNLLSLDEEEEGTTPYKDLKIELLRLYSPKPEDAFDKAINRVMKGKPSTLARDIINDICRDCRVPLSCPCCAKIIFGMWRRSLPNHIVAHISNLPFNADTYLNVLQVADNVYASHKPASQSVSAATVSSTPTGAAARAQVSEEASSTNPTVAAVNQPRGRGAAPRGQAPRGGNRGNNQRGAGRGFGRGNRGQGRGGGQTGQREYHPVHKGPRHHSLPPLEACRTHWLFGGEAKWCEDTFTCPWKNFTSQPNSQNNK